MITPQTIGNILYRDCKVFGIDEIHVVFAGDNSDEIKSGEVEGERIVIYVKNQQPETYWKKSFNEINILVPRIQNLPNRIRLEELEKMAIEVLDGITERCDGYSYLYSIYSIGTMTDAELNCEYVNVKVLFEVLNVK